MSRFDKIEQNEIAKIAKRVAPAGGGGVTDHGALTGLGDDDHTQYLNNARGDARYSQPGHTHPISDLQAISATKLIGRTAASSGVPQEVTVGSGLKLSSASPPTISTDGSVVASATTSVLAGTGLTGGGDLSTDRTISVDFAASGVSSSTKAVRADDSRLSDARTPTSHTHALTDLTQTGAEKYMVPHWDGTNWSPIDFLGSTKRIMCASEMNAAEAFTVYANGTGSANAFNIQGIGFDGRFGILRCGTGSTNAGRSGIGSANDLDSIQLGTYATEMTAIVYLGNTSTSTERYTAIVGFTDSRTGTATDGVYFTYTDNVNSGNWTCNVISNGVGADSSSGVSMVSTSWYKLRIVVNAAGTESKFYINDSLVGTMTNTHPTGSTRRTALACGLFKQVGTSNREMYIDYLNLIIDSER